MLPKGFQDQLMESIKESMKTDVLKAVQDTQIREINRVVYKAYSPKDYIRRYNRGGLIDKKNIEGTVSKSATTATLSVLNTTKPNMIQGDYWWASNQYLTPLIVLGGHQHLLKYGGLGYSWYPYPRNKADQYNDPRDFITATKNSLGQKKYHVNALRSSLKRKGIEVT